MAIFSKRANGATNEFDRSSKGVHYCEGGKQFPVKANPEAKPKGETVRSEADTDNVHLSEVSRVEKLLSQLEARSMALVRYDSGNLRETPVKNWHAGLITTALLVIWLGTLALAVGYFANQQLPQIAEGAAPDKPRTMPWVNNEQQNVSRSTAYLVKALAASAARLGQINATIEKSNRDLQHLAAEVHNKGTGPISTLPTDNSVGLDQIVATPARIPAAAVPVSLRVVATSLAGLVAAPTVAPRVDSTPGGRAATSGVSVGASASATIVPAPVGASSAEESPSRKQYRVLEIKPTHAALPHKAPDGTIDYWLVARGASQRPTKVQPIARSVDGVVIFNLEDGKNYIVTPLGEWRASEW
jgi:hypothetical protein